MIIVFVVGVCWVSVAFMFGVFVLEILDLMVLERVAVLAPSPLRSVGTSAAVLRSTYPREV